MKKTSLKWTIGISIVIAILTFIMGISHIYIANYNAEINKSKENINGKVLSGLFLNFGHIQVANSFFRREYYLLEGDLLEGDLSKLKERISRKKIDIENTILELKVSTIIGEISISEIPTDETKEEIKKITSSPKSFDEKYNELNKISQKNIGIVQSYLDKEYSKLKDIERKLAISSFIQLLALIFLFITSATLSILPIIVGRNDEAPNVKSHKKSSKRTKKTTGG